MSSLDNDSESTGSRAIYSFSDFLECEGFTERKYINKFCHSYSLRLSVRNHAGSP